MRAATLSRIWIARRQADDKASRSPTRELAMSLSASAGLAAVLFGMGFVTGSRPCATAAALWGLVTAGIIGTNLAGRNIPWGWLLLVSLQPLWISYALVTEQYGFVVGSVCYGIGQLNGFLRSRRGA
jgi:hypothetical protein